MLRSWAVPRGLPPTSGDNRLAVAVPDHAMDHLGYKDEHKSIADTGWWEEHDRTNSGCCSPCTVAKETFVTR